MPKLSRYQTNCLIMAKLQRLIDRYPDQRFHQILQNIGVEDPGHDQFYEESTDTLETISRFEEALKQIMTE